MEGFITGQAQITQSYRGSTPLDILRTADAEARHLGPAGRDRLTGRQLSFS